MVLPVRVSLVSGTALAHTIDISYSGARLGGIREGLKPGDLISLTRGSQRAKFRIVWVQQLGEHEFHAGVEAINVQEKFWGVDLSAKDREAQENTEMLLSLLKGGGKR